MPKKPKLISRAVKAVRKPQAVKERTVKHPFAVYQDPDYEPPPPDGVTYKTYSEMELSRVGGAPLSQEQKAGIKVEGALAAQRRLERLRASL